MPAIQGVRLSWPVTREAHMVRRLGRTVVGVVAGAVLVWLDWHPGSVNPAMPVTRATMIAVVLLLAVLPWVFGRVADNRQARIVRTGGYLAMYALLAAMVGLSRFAGGRFDDMRAFDQDNWNADMRDAAVVSAVLVVAVVGGYAVAILAITARRMATDPSTLGICAGLGATAAVVMFALMPLGNFSPPDNKVLATGYVLLLVLVPPAALTAAGVYASRRTGSLRQAVIAGLSAGAATALLLNILTITTMLLLPGQVDLKWANPDPSAPHGTPFEVRMSVGDAAVKYEAGLVLGPLIGLALGALGWISESSKDVRRTDLITK